MGLEQGQECLLSLPAPKMLSPVCILSDLQEIQGGRDDKA